MPARSAPLWKCPRCRRAFANRNQTHTCSNTPIAAHFRKKPPATRALYNQFLRSLRAHGPVKVLPEKTRIAFQARMSFAAVMVRRHHLRGHLVLAQRHPHPCFLRVTTFSPRNHVHEFELRSPADLTAPFRRFLAMAYRVGRQEHLAGRPRAAPAVR